MKKNVGRYLFTLIIIAGFLTGCATPYSPLPAFNAQPVPNGQFDKKVEHLVFVLDASGSMGEVYQGHQKLDIARGVVDNFNKTMPDVDVMVSLRSFGHSPKVSSQPTALMLKPQAYNSAALDGALKEISAAGGSSPLGRPLKEVAVDLKGVKVPVAMVIVTDGKEASSSPLSAAQALAADHENLCIYTVQVGNDPGGKALLEKIASAGKCGKAVNADALASGASMADFVKEVLLTQKNDSDGDGVVDDKDRCPNTPSGVTVDMNGCPLDSDGDGVADYKDQCPNTPRGVTVDMKGCPLDSDGDGVLDYKDQCPGTPRGTQVDAVGCPIPVATKSAEVTAAGTWLYKDIQFENNKSDLKESSYPTLNEITAALKAQPNLNIEIQGHTDGSGTHDYNVGLSKRRAQSVKAYLENQGIAAQRMTTEGFGPDRPIASNHTKEGRARNRRVEIKPVQ